jgi:hypothetical protein
MEDNKEDIKSTVENQLEELIRYLVIMDTLIDLADLRNEQFVLDFYDRLNEISVRK